MTRCPGVASVGHNRSAMGRAPRRPIVRQVAPVGARETPMARILLADDDEAVRGPLSAQLNQMGHEVDLAENGKDAVGLAFGDRVRPDHQRHPDAGDRTGSSS